MGKYKYLIYDFDGTISDTYEGVAEALKKTFDHYNLEVDEKLYGEYIGPPVSETFMSYLNDSEKAYEAVEFYKQYYADSGAIYKTKLYDGIKETLKSLKDKGYKLLIASCKKHEEAVMLLKLFGIYEYIDFVSGLCYNIRETKREVLEYAVEKMNCDIKDCVMIGDTKFDVEGAEELNMDCILCLWGFGKYDEIKNSNVVYRAKTPYDVEKYIEE